MEFVHEGFSISETSAQTMTFKVRCSCHIRDDKDIGEVHVPIKELANAVDESNTTDQATYPVKKPSGKPKGELCFLFKFGDRLNINMNSAVTAYPDSSHNAGVSSLYPPPAATATYPPNAGGYMAPSWPRPPPGYPQCGLGYYSPVVQPAAQNCGISGSKSDAAFLGGLLGGFIIGGMVTEANNHDYGGYQEGGGCGY